MTHDQILTKALDTMNSRTPGQFISPSPVVLKNGQSFAGVISGVTIERGGKITFAVGSDDRTIDINDIASI